MSNHTDGLLSNQTRDFIKNRYIQHIISFMLLFVLITLFSDVGTREAVVYTLLGYVWFVFSTKLDIHWNIVIIILLFSGYIFEHSNKQREKEIREDPNLTDAKRNQLLLDIDTYRKWFIGAIIIVTIAGTVLYSHKKAEQYGGGYDVFVYFLGSN